MAQQYPTGCKLYVDGVDVTKWVFGTSTIDPTDTLNTWRNIDISTFIKGPGMHKIEITATGGVGRVEARVEIR